MALDSFHVKVGAKRAWLSFLRRLAQAGWQHERVLNHFTLCLVSALGFLSLFGGHFFFSCLSLDVQTSIQLWFRRTACREAAPGGLVSSCKPAHVRRRHSASVLNICRCPGFLRLRKEACNEKSWNHRDIASHPAAEPLNLSRQAEHATREVRFGDR